MTSLHNYLTRQLEAEKELKHVRTVLGFQVATLVTLPITWIIVSFIQWMWPGFFVYPYFTWEVTGSVIGRFWPLFTYAGIMAILTSLSLLSTKSDEEILIMDSVTSVLAGIWEELGFRWLYICSGMVGLVISNWILGSLIGSVLAIVTIIIGVAMLVAAVKARNTRGFLGALLVFCPAILWGYVLWWLGYQNPVYWIWSNILVPITDVVSLGYLGDILYSNAIPPLFLFGMLAANIKFRDGHKYQGPIGMVNAWYIGLVMIYATITYGLGVAIALHALYDLEIGFIKYVVRKAVNR